MRHIPCMALLVWTGLGHGPVIHAQGLPNQVREELTAIEAYRTLDALSELLSPASRPSPSDVVGVLTGWRQEANGPHGSWQWLSAANLWIRAGEADSAFAALKSVTAPVPVGINLLSRARAGFLTNNLDSAAAAYWAGCRDPSVGVSGEYWSDMSIVATPDELRAWSGLSIAFSDSSALCEHIHRFWSERALRSGLTITDRLDVHYDRMRFARERYRRPRESMCGDLQEQVAAIAERIGGCDPGLDDRGLIYLRMGAPDRQASFGGAVQWEFMSPACFAPNVSWIYYYPDGPRTFHFSPLGGGWGWRLLRNLEAVYLCGDPDRARSPTGVVTYHQVEPGNTGARPPIEAIAYLVLTDLYASRSTLDPAYGIAAARMSDPAKLAQVGKGEPVKQSDALDMLDVTRALSEEAARNWADAVFAITRVADSPAVATDARMLFEILQFRGIDPDTRVIWANAVVDGGAFTPVQSTAGAYEYHLETLFGSLAADGRYQTFARDINLTSHRQLSSGESIPVRVPALASPGELRYTFVVHDIATDQTDDAGTTGNYATDTLTVRSMTGELPELSDIVVAPDSGGTWTVDSRVFLRPSPRHNTGDDGVAHVYLEAYGLTSGAPYRAVFRIEPEDGERPFEVRFEGQAADRGITSMYYRLDLSESEPGFYRMTVTVTDIELGIESLPHRTNVHVDEVRSAD